jgi:hypothetical protein
VLFFEDLNPLKALSDSTALEYSEEPVMIFSLESPRNDLFKPSA